jgi:ABC-type uncharacterized transport system ATPase subunit
LTFGVTVDAIAHSGGRWPISGTLQMAVEEVPRDQQAAGIAGRFHVAVNAVIENLERGAVVSQRNVAINFSALNTAAIAD